MRRRRNFWAVLGVVLVTSIGGPRGIWADEQGTTGKRDQGPGPQPVAAQPTVAVLDAPKIQPVLIKALARSGEYKVLPPAQWDATAKQLNATGHAADEIAVVATELKVSAVVTTTVKKDKDSGQWMLLISARYGPTGKVVDRLRYPLKNQRVDKATLAQAAAELGPIVAKAIKGPPEPPPVAPGQPDLNAPTAKAEEPPGREDEDPIKRMAKNEEEERRHKAKVRPKWYPYVDLAVGFGIEGRRFYYDENAATSTYCYDLNPLPSTPQNPSLSQSGTAVSYVYSRREPCAGFKLSVAPLIRLDATFYPLAGVGLNPLRGLGLGLTADIPIWAASKDMSGTSLATTELRIEAGLRWAWNILNRRDRPSLLMMLQYGLHSFAIQKKQSVLGATDQNGTTTMVSFSDDHSQPDLSYQYVDIGLGARVPWLVTDRHYFATLVDFHYHAVLRYGEVVNSFPAGDTNLQDLYLNSGYGPVSGSYGLRVGLTPIEWMPWKGLTVRVNGYYELFSMAFALANPSNGMVPSGMQFQLPVLGNAARHLAQSATDQYFGVMGQIGWQY